MHARQLREAVGSEIGVSHWIEIDQARIDKFAEATEDHQWIHVDPGRAKSGQFGTTIAHGHLTLSLVSPAVRDVLHLEGVRMAINDGLDRVRFASPLPSGSRARGRVAVLQADELDDGALQVALRVTIEREGGERPVCVADSRSRYYF
jgi:acyl dehydratase